MQNWDTPYLTDWFTISLRWLILVGLSISLGVSNRLNGILVGILAASILWNGFVSVLATFSIRLKMHRLINVGIDLLIILLLFYFSGGISGPFVWIFILPAITSALYYELKGVLFTALVTSLFQAAIVFLDVGYHALPIPLAGLLGFNLVTGIVINAVAIPFLVYLKHIYQNQTRQRKEGERIAKQQERDRMRSLFEMIETFSSTLNYQTVLQTALDTGIAALGSVESDDTAGAVLLFEDQDLELKVSIHFFQSDLTVQLPAQDGVLAEVLKSGEEKLVVDPHKDPELSQLATLENHPIALLLPMIRGLNAFGVMLFSHNNPNFFTQDRIEILQMISNQAVIALQNARLYQDLAYEKERIVQSQEEAQKKLARDLHDGPTQSVSAIAMRVNIARKMLTSSPQETEVELEKIEELARRTVDEIRHMLFTLRPLVMESEGLDAALNTLAEKMFNLYKQKVHISLDPLVVNELDATHQMVIFYMTDEAINNARKHAKAPGIWVKLKYVPEDHCIAVLEIIDNGVGFDVNEVFGSYNRRGSLGMVNLQERADQINGVLHIDSVQGKGTRIQVLIPLNAESADRLHQSR